MMTGVQTGPGTAASVNADSREVVAEAIGLAKRYGPVVAVDGVSLRVERGEVFGFLGPNGAGKTTTIGMMIGMIAPSSGEVRLFGRPLLGNEGSALSRVGALVEVPTFYPYLGARDNLRVVARVHGGVETAAIERVLRLANLAAVGDRPFRTFSLGMKQRLGIAAALLADPELVILDEPTNGLDPAGIVETRQLLRDLAAEGRAVMLSSHQLNEVERICDRVAIVNRGRIVVEGSVADLLRPQRLTRVTVTDVPAALEVLAGLTWVGRVYEEGGAIAVSGDPPHPFALSEALGGAGVWVGHLSRSEGSLEQLFLSLTGAPDSRADEPIGADRSSNGHHSAVPERKGQGRVGRGR